MMGSDEPGPGAWDEGDWADMAQWMQQMHGTGTGARAKVRDMAQWMQQMHGTSPGAEDEGAWADMAQWMEQMHGSGPGLCPHWGYASPGAGDTPAG